MVVNDIPLLLLLFLPRLHIESNFVILRKRSGLAACLSSSFSLPLFLGWLSLLEEIDSASHAAHFFSSSLPQEFPNRPKTAARNFATFCTPRRQQRQNHPPSLWHPTPSGVACTHAKTALMALPMGYRIVSHRKGAGVSAASSTNLIYYFEKQSISNRIVF